MKHLLTLLLFPALCSAQEKPARPHDWLVKVNIATPIDFITFPTISFSAERGIGKYYSISAEGGYQLYSFDKVDTTFKMPTGFKANVELRRYAIRIRRAYPENLEGMYFGMNVFYAQNNANKKLDYYTQTPWEHYKDNFTVFTKAYGINAVFGFQKRIFSRFYFDWYVRVGVMNREITNSHREYDNGEHYRRRNLFSMDLVNHSLSESSGGVGNLGFGARIAVGL